MSRCPHCGRPESDAEKKTFDKLRKDTASALEQARKAEEKSQVLSDERDALKVRNADLRAVVKELKAGG